jgi:thioredoxin-like negative regulator of GroEL
MEMVRLKWVSRVGPWRLLVMDEKQPGSREAQGFFQSGVVAYREHKYRHAILQLGQALAADPANHRARLYLAMSYYYDEDLSAAHKHLLHLRDNCIDRDIRQQAESAIAVIGQIIEKRRTAPPTTGEDGFL